MLNVTIRHDTVKLCAYAYLNGLTWENPVPRPANQQWINRQPLFWVTYCFDVGDARVYWSILECKGKENVHIKKSLSIWFFLSVFQHCILKIPHNAKKTLYQCYLTIIYVTSLYINWEMRKVHPLPLWFALLFRNCDTKHTFLKICFLWCHKNWYSYFSQIRLQPAVCSPL